MKKKVLIFLQSGVGGAERVTVIIGKNIDPVKYDVVFCTIGNAADKQSIENFIPQRFNKISLPSLRGVKLLFALKRVLNRERPNIVFSSIMYVNSKLLALSPFYPKTKFIVRNNNYLYTLSKVQKNTLRLFYRFADVVIAQTEEMKKELTEKLKISPEKIFVLHNPVDTETIDAKKDECCPFDKSSKVIYVASGRFHPVKGFDILIKAFGKVLLKQTNAELHILGKTNDNCEEYYKEIADLVQKEKLSDHVFFEGFQLNPYVYMKNADCFVLSSRNEGLPNVMIESLYLGTPVAATKCIPIISRIVCDGVNGFLAEPENVDSLSDAMLKASALGRVSNTYQSASNGEFQRMFEL